MMTAAYNWMVQNVWGTAYALQEGVRESSDTPAFMSPLSILPSASLHRGYVVGGRGIMDVFAEKHGATRDVPTDGRTAAATTAYWAYIAAAMLQARKEDPAPMLTIGDRAYQRATGLLPGAANSFFDAWAVQRQMESLQPGSGVLPSKLVGYTWRAWALRTGVTTGVLVAGTVAVGGYYYWQHRQKES